jgi:hypothetical protein
MKKLAVSLVLFAALAACSDSPVQAPDSNEPRIIAVYDESDFAARGITAPDVNAITRAAGTGPVNRVARLGTRGAFGSPSAAYYRCDEQPIFYYEYDYYNGCYPPTDCYANPYGYNCGDPCQWDSSLPECAPPPPPGPAAQFSYGSDASGPVWVNQGGTLLKEVSLTSWSTAGANVAFTTLDASFRNVGAQSGAGCGNASQQFDSSHSSGSGNPLTLQSSRVANYLGTIKWEVWGTHGFTPVSGASGGGTFYSSDFVCG